MMATSLEFKLPADPCPMPTMGSDDEESFVVLGRSLVPDVDLSFNNLHIEPVQSGPIEEGKKLIKMELSQLETSTLPQMPYVHQQISDQDTTISVTTISSELTPEEVQQKVDVLIAENIKLRETIIKNNTAMETQHERIIAWKEDVQKTHQAHKLKFAEAKDFITKLKADKELLILELEKSNEIKEMQQLELFRLKAELKSKDVTERGTDTQSVSLISNRGSQLGQNAEQQIEKNSYVDEELKSAKSRIVELEGLLQMINLARDRLAKENEELKSSNKLATSNSEKLVQLSSEVEEKQKIIDQLSSKLKDTQESTEKVIKGLNVEIINIRSQLCLSVNLQEDLDNLRKQLMASQASITALQQTNTVLTAQLTVEQEKVKELRKLEVLRDDHFALQQQVELYKADFETERQTKENLRAEKDQIIKDFLEIQKRNNELHEEIELLKERGFEVIGSRSVRSSNSSTASSASSQEQRYTCPICNFGFTTYQALENHIERCMDLNASLP